MPRKKAVKPTPEERAQVRDIAKQLEGWTQVGQYLGSNGTSIHTVDRYMDNKTFRCTCQGFKIHKRGECKHTRWAARGIFATPTDRWSY
jgi:hypothetical protein